METLRFAFSFDLRAHMIKPIGKVLQSGGNPVGVLRNKHTTRHERQNRHNTCVCHHPYLACIPLWNASLSWTRFAVHPRLHGKLLQAFTFSGLISQRARGPDPRLPRIALTTDTECSRRPLENFQ